MTPETLLAIMFLAISPFIANVILWTARTYPFKWIDLNPHSFDSSKHHFHSFFTFNLLKAIRSGDYHAHRMTLATEVSLVFLTGITLFSLSGHSAIEIISAMILIYFLVVIILIDMQYKFIFDAFSLPLLWIGLALSLLPPTITPEEAIKGALLGYLLPYSIYMLHKTFSGREGMGFGDFKLIAALGAWFGIHGVVEIMIIASVTSIVAFVILFALKKHDLGKEMAFGPFIAIGALFVLLSPIHIIGQ